MGLEAQFGRLEESIRTSFLAAVTGRAVSDVDRDLLSLPAKLGGIGVPNPVSCASAARQSALSVTQPLVDHLLDPHPSISIDRVFAVQASASSIARQDKIEALNKQADNIKVKLSPRAQAAMTLAQERGASSWLTALPLSGHGFSLSKADFRDALCLRYGWTPPRLPTLCVCGKQFSLDHSLVCSHGGYLGIRHNEVRDLLAKLVDETSHNVCIEPVLQPLSGERFSSASTNTAAEARVDIKASGFWSERRHECAFFDVRVFYPHAHSYRHLALDQSYKLHEKTKRREYEERIREVDRGSFTPLVFSSSGGAGPAATAFLKRLASRLAEKRDIPYSQVAGWLRCRLSFALLRCSILCLRGARAVRAPVELAAPDLAMSEGRIVLN